jgi:hypothetical protein
MDKIRKNHPDLKGSFLSMGCWFNLFNKESMAEFEAMKKRLGPKDLRTSEMELKVGVLLSERWERDPDLWWLYDEANKQGDWSVEF